MYVVAHPERDRVTAELRARGIGTKVHFPYPIHLMEAYAFLGYRPGDLPVTERAAKEIFSLPLFPEMTPGQVDRVIAALREILA